MKESIALSCMWLNATQAREGRGDSSLTYVPDTFNDKPALWAQWKRDDADLLAKKGSPLSLKEQLALQSQRMSEAQSLQERRIQYERKHMKVMGKTSDLCHGKLDDLLANTKELTASRKI